MKKSAKQNNQKYFKLDYNEFNGKFFTIDKSKITKEQLKQLEENINRNNK